MSSDSSSGFDFTNSVRNEILQNRGNSLPKALSTGTTIVGCVFKDGVLLGADTRSTMGSVISDKNCVKIHYLTESIRCCGAGTAADTEYTTALVSSNLELHSLSNGRKPRVVTALTMLKQMLFKYQGHVSAALVLGGVDDLGPHLHQVFPHGSTATMPYIAMGSGTYAAMAILEHKWRPDMEREAALELVIEAVSAGIFNDLGSGSNVDACVITKDRTEMLRNIRKPNERLPKEKNYVYRRGTTVWMKETVRSLVVNEKTVPVGEAMDTT